MTLERRADGRVDLLAGAVPLAGVLDCLVERLGLRIEYEGPAPQQLVSVELRGESLVGAIESLFKGLGVNYMLGLDPSGADVDRLIVFGASEVSAPAGPSPAGEPEPFGVPKRQPPRGSQPYPTAPPSSQAPGEPLPAPGGALQESPPLPVEPEELTPVTLQLTPRHGSSVVARGTSPVS